MARQSIYTENAPKPTSPYVQGTSANGFVFVSGQVSRDAKSGDFVDGPFEDNFAVPSGTWRPFSWPAAAASTRS